MLFTVISPSISYIANYIDFNSTLYWLLTMRLNNGPLMRAAPHSKWQNFCLLQLERKCIHDLWVCVYSTCMHGYIMWVYVCMYVQNVYVWCVPMYMQYIVATRWLEFHVLPFSGSVWGSLCGSSCVLQIGLSPVSHVAWVNDLPHRVQPTVFVALVGKRKSVQGSLKAKPSIIPHVLQVNALNLKVFQIRVNSWTHFTWKKQVHLKCVQAFFVRLSYLSKIQILWYAGLIG